MFNSYLKHRRKSFSGNPFTYVTDYTNGSNSVGAFVKTAGNFYLVFCKWEGAANITSITDGSSNVYYLLPQTDHSNNDLHCCIGWTVSKTSFSSSTSFTCSGTPTFQRIIVFEFLVSGDVHYDQFNSNYGTGASITTGEIITSRKNSLVFCVFGEYSAIVLSDPKIANIEAKFSTMPDYYARAWFILPSFIIEGQGTVTQNAGAAFIAQIASFYAETQRRASLAVTGEVSNIDAYLPDSSTSVTVPSDANLVVAFWSLWTNNDPSTVTSLTLNGSAFTIDSSISEFGNIASVGVAHLFSPSTGSQTLAWTGTGGVRTEGGMIVLVYVKGAKFIRDTAVNAAELSTAAPITIDSNVSDLILGFGQTFNYSPDFHTPVFNCGINNLLINDSLLRKQHYDVAEITATTASTTIDITDPAYSTTAGISIG